MMFRNGLLSKFFAVIFLTVFTASFSYAGNEDDNDDNNNNTATTIPANAYQDVNSWTCAADFFRNSDETGCLPVPENASSSYFSNDFICDAGYQKKNGNSCVKQRSGLEDTGIIIDPLNGSPLPEKDPETSTLTYVLIIIAFLLIVLHIAFKIERRPKLTIKRRSLMKIKVSTPLSAGSNQTETIKSLKSDSSTLMKSIEDMNQTFMTLKTNLDQKDEEISRYKDGYDATIYKNFLLRFTRVDKVIKEYIGDNKIDINGLKDIQIQMDDALAECGVEIFSLEIGADFKSTIGVADNPEIRETSDKSKDSTIAEILIPGYRRKLPSNANDDYQIIIEAKVVIYVYKET